MKLTVSNLLPPLFLLAVWIYSPAAAQDKDGLKPSSTVDTVRTVPASSETSIDLSAGTDASMPADTLPVKQDQSITDTSAALASDTLALDVEIPEAETTVPLMEASTSDPPSKADKENQQREAVIKQQQEAYQREQKSGRTDYRQSEMEPGMQPAVPEKNVERGETDVRTDQYERAQGDQGRTIRHPERADEEEAMRQQREAERKQREQRSDEIDKRSKEEKPQGMTE